MKKINIFIVIFSVLLLPSLQASEAVSFCDGRVERIISNIGHNSYLDEVIKKIEVKFERFSGLHQKLYKAEITFDSKKPNEIYNVKVFEFETPHTNCIIDQISRLNP